MHISASYETCDCGCHSEVRGFWSRLVCARARARVCVCWLVRRLVFIMMSVCSSACPCFPLADSETQESVHVFKYDVQINNARATDVTVLLSDQIQMQSHKGPLKGQRNLISSFNESEQGKHSSRSQVLAHYWTLHEKITGVCMWVCGVEVEGVCVAHT